MSEHEGMLVQLGSLLSRVARPHRCDDRLPDDVQAGLWELGVPCGAETSREELVTRLWARKRSLLLMMQPEWGGPGVTPPNAA
jgi:hypothetical protein